MPNAYDDKNSAADFTKFIDSEDGTVQKQILWENIFPCLSNPKAQILDAACGQGWLAGKLSEYFPNVEAFDSSPHLINQAKANFPQINFQIADATTTLPYSDDQFDVVILNMAAHDLSDLAKSFQNFHRVLKPGGQFLITMANPYYSFPVGVWKRGLKGFLLRQKAKLQVRPYHNFSQQKNQLHNWSGQMSSYFYPLSEYVNQTLQAGFNLKILKDLGSEQDSNSYDARYRLHRFPMILLLVFEKSGK